jgi:hypothetical protein
MVILKYKMSPIVQEHLVSALQTFASGFLTALIPAFQGSIEWTTAFWVAVALTAIRAGVKEVLAQYAPKALGGRQ